MFSFVLESFYIPRRPLMRRTWKTDTSTEPRTETQLRARAQAKQVLHQFAVVFESHHIPRRPLMPRTCNRHSHRTTLSTTVARTSWHSATTSSWM